MPGALHVVAARFRPDADATGVEHALEAARALAEAPGVETVLVARTDEQLVVATWLEGREALDAFAESRAHMSFVMRGLAPVIRGMWSAAIEAECDLPPTDTAALWAFALPTTEGVYEWQVRDLLAAIEALPGAALPGAALPGAAVTGPTVEERERYRAGGLLCLTAVNRAAFETALPEARTQWAEAAGGAVQEALADVLPA